MQDVGTLVGELDRLRAAAPPARPAPVALAEPQRTTYIVARSRLMAEEWAREQPDTAWSEWRGPLGSGPWRYIGRPARELAGRDPKTMRVVLIDMPVQELSADSYSMLAYLHAHGALVEEHRDLRRIDPGSTVHWRAHEAFGAPVTGLRP